MFQQFPHTRGQTENCDAIFDGGGDILDLRIPFCRLIFNLSDMKRVFCIGILSAATLAACAGVQYQTYSLGAYSGGTSYFEICSLALPVPPYQFKLTSCNWFEDTNGLHIISLDQQAKGIPQRSIAVECGSNSFRVPLTAASSIIDTNSAPVIEGSGDLVQLVKQCATGRGGHATTNPVPAIQASWIQQSRELQDIIVVNGNHFTDFQRFLEQAYGSPDATIQFSTALSARSLTYTPREIGVVLNLTADSCETILSIIGRRKP